MHDTNNLRDKISLPCAISRVVGKCYLSLHRLRVAPTSGYGGLCFVHILAEPLLQRRLSFTAPVAWCVAMAAAQMALMVTNECNHGPINYMYFTRIHM